MQNAVIAHAPDGKFDIAALKAKAAAWPGIDGMDLVPSVGAQERYDWNETTWRLGAGYGARDGAGEVPRRRHRLWREAQHPAPAGRSGLRGDRRARDRDQRARFWR